MKKILTLIFAGVMALSSCTSPKYLGRTDELIAGFSPMCLDYNGHDKENGIFYFSNPAGSWDIQMFEKGRNVEFIIYYMTNEFAESFFSYLEGLGNYQCTDTLCIGPEVTYEFIDLEQGKQIIVTPSVQH